MANPKYEVTASQPWMYLDEFQRTIKGFRVYFRIIAYNEMHYIEVPRMDKEEVKSKIEKTVAARDSLASL